MGKDKCLYQKKPVVHNLSCDQNKCSKPKPCLTVVKKGKPYCGEEECAKSESSSSSSLHGCTGPQEEHHSEHGCTGAQEHCSESSSSSSHHKKHKPCKPKKKPCKPQKKPCKPKKKLTVIQHCSGDKCERKESESSSSEEKHCNKHNKNSFSEKHSDSESDSECACCNHN